METKNDLRSLVSRTIVDRVTQDVMDYVEKNNLTFSNKRKINVADSDMLSRMNVEVGSDLKIVDNAMYTEYELTTLSNRFFMTPQANYPLLDVLTVSSEGADKEAIIYKIFDMAGEFGGSVDKGNPETLISVNANAEAFTKRCLNAYTESISLKEIALSVSTGSNILGRLMDAVNMGFLKTIHRVIYLGEDVLKKYTIANAGFKYKLQLISGAVIQASGDAFQDYIDAGTSIKIYEAIAGVVNAMVAKGKGNDGVFRPNIILMSPTIHSLIDTTLMANAGQFRGTIREYVEDKLRLKMVAYQGIEDDGSKKLIFLNNMEQNNFVGIPNPLTILSDVKFEETTYKTAFETVGLVNINSGSVGYLTGIEN